ncbi:MAG: CAP domain-containing protein, partial [Solirubrobacterales bacterium]
MIVALAMLGALTLIPASPASASLVAPGSKCRGQQNTHASKGDQKHAMLCLINYAREHAHSGHLKPNHALERAAGRKAGDVMRCGFSHEACGRPGDFYAHQFGYTSSSSWAWGENLAWGRGKGGTARSILKQWLNSPPHRETMLRGAFEDVGIGLRTGHFS